MMLASPTSVLLCVPHLPLQREKQQSLVNPACMARLQGKHPGRRAQGAAAEGVGQPGCI